MKDILNFGKPVVKRFSFVWVELTDGNKLQEYELQ